MKLPQKWIDYLVEQPETWMGTQLCTIKDKDGTHDNVIVIGCQEVYGVIDAVDKPARPCNVDVDSITDIKVHTRA